MTRRLATAAALAAILAACGDDSVDPVDPDAAVDDADAGAVAPDAEPIDPTEQVFDLDVLHEIEITVDEQWLEQLDEDRENRVPCTITFDGITLDDAGIRQKGGIGSVSNLAGKPGFSLKFDEFVADQELLGLDKLILNNAVQDPSFLHEHLGYHVYRQAGIPAHRTSFGVVTFNDFTYGLFVINEAVNKRFLRRHFGQANDEGNLYEGECCADFVFDPQLPDLKRELEEMRVRDDLVAFAALIRDTSNAQLEAALEQSLDLDGFVTGYAIDAVFFHWDGYAYNTNNHYIYHEPTSDRLVFMPHGMDQLLQQPEFNPFPGPPDDTWPRGRLAQRMHEVPALRARWVAEVDRVVDELWDVPALLDRVDQAAATLRTSTHTDPRTVGDLARFEESLQPTRDAIAERKLRFQTRDSAVCGDGAIDGFEWCDDSNADSEDGCSSVCHWEWCGDEILQVGLGEACDGPDCLPDCSGAAVCAEVAGTVGTLVVCPQTRNIWEAFDWCVADGGALAAPLDSTENDLIIATAFGVFDESYWIGVHDTLEEGVWMDVSSTPITFEAWAPGKPDGGTGQNCVVVDANYAGGWNDKGCWQEHGFVCRRP